MKRTYIALLISCLFFVCCSGPPQQKTPATPVNLYAVKSMPVFYFDKYPANVVALNQVDLRPEVQGYITDITFTEGSHVKKGQELYKIDQRLYQSAYDAAKANLDIAKDNLTLAQQDADRYNYLNNADAIAKQTLDHAMIALEQAKSSVKASEQALKIAETNLQYSVITAPFDGTIGISQVRLGNLVTVGQTVLNTISTDDPIGVDFLISEKQLQHFEDLKNNQQQTVDSLFTIVLPNGTVYPQQGKISIIDRAVDPQTGTIRVRVTFPNTNYVLKPGLSCVIRVHNQDTKPQLVVPNKAVIELMGEYFVFAAIDTTMRDPQDSTKTIHVLAAFQKKVQLGQIVAPNIVILSGVKEGDQIVVDGVQTLHKGSIISAGQKPANGGDKEGNKNSAGK